MCDDDNDDWNCRARLVWQGGRERGREGGGSIGFDQGNRQNGVRSIGSLQFPVIGTDLDRRSNLVKASLGWDGAGAGGGLSLVVRQNKKKERVANGLPRSLSFL